VNPSAGGIGMLAYWNAGILCMVELDLFFMDGGDYKIKSGNHPLLIRYIQYSIFLSDP
jgi:hypothetical protein